MLNSYNHITLLPVNDIYKGFAIITDIDNKATFIYTPTKNYDFDQSKEFVDRINQSGITTIFENTKLQYISNDPVAPWTTFGFNLEDVGTITIDTDDSDNYTLKTNDDIVILTGVNIDLKSVHPEVYSGITITCKLIQNTDIGRYLARIPNDRKITGIKPLPVIAKNGEKGFKVHNQEKVIYEGREYIIKEEDSIISERYMPDGSKITDVLVTNINTQEQKIINVNNFASIYKQNPDITYSLIKEPKQLTKVDENIVIMTKNGKPAICLKGSYIATYDEATDDYDVIEQKDFETSYTKI